MQYYDTSWCHGTNTPCPHRRGKLLNAEWTNIAYAHSKYSPSQHSERSWSCLHILGHDVSFRIYSAAFHQLFLVSSCRSTDIVTQLPIPILAQFKSVRWICVRVGCDIILFRLKTHQKWTISRLFFEKLTSLRWIHWSRQSQAITSKIDWIQFAYIEINIFIQSRATYGDDGFFVALTWIGALNQRN